MTAFGQAARSLELVSATEVHGVCDDDVQGKPTFGQIAGSVTSASASLMLGNDADGKRK